MNKKILGIFACLIIGIPFTVFCLDREESRTLLNNGIEAYRRSNFFASANAFHNVMENGTAAEKADAYFWFAKSLMALERFDEASINLEHFIRNFPGSSFYPEAFYERGRLLYFQREFDAAVVAFENFLSRFPESDFAANAYFWAGESLFALGNLEPAERMYEIVISRYPTSSRVEAARYRFTLIGLKYREEELLKLLKWSHEEYINSLGARRNLERIYAEIVSSYQRQITALATGDLHAEVIRLSEEVRVLKAELSRRSFVEALPVQMDADFDARMHMLSAREDAVVARELYLQQLIAEYEEKR